MKVDTSGGRIESIDGSGTLEARTSGGSIVVRNFGGDTKVETSGGRLAFENINGKITGRTSGGSITARLRSPVPGDVDLETSAGSIEVTVPPDAGLNVEAETSSGRVTSDLPFVGTRTDRDSMKGQINGGGKSLLLRSGAGSISIKPAGAEVAAHDEIQISKRRASAKSHAIAESRSPSIAEVRLVQEHVASSMVRHLRSAISP